MRRTSEVPKTTHFTDKQITAAAKALCKDASLACNVDFEDNWKIYSELYRDQVLIVIEAFAAMENLL